MAPVAECVNAYIPERPFVLDTTMRETRFVKLSAFVAVADCGSFTKASAQLGITTSSRMVRLSEPVVIPSCAEALVKLPQSATATKALSLTKRVSRIVEHFADARGGVDEFGFLV